MEKHFQLEGTVCANDVPLEPQEAQIAQGGVSWRGTSGQGPEASAEIFVSILLA